MITSFRLPNASKAAAKPVADVVTVGPTIPWLASTGWINGCDSVGPNSQAGATTHASARIAIDMVVNRQPIESLGIALTPQADHWASVV
jgi:hypothetical protein